MRDLLLLLLAATSGYVDALSYQGLGHVFTSNMTGNSVLLGLAAAQAEGLAALRSGIALLGFLCGAGVGASIVGQDKRQEVWPFPVTAALALEALVLLAFVVIGSVVSLAANGWVLSLLIALSALAIGIQSASISSLGVSGISTTYITGTWTSLMSGIVRRLRAIRSKEQQPRPTRSPPRGARLQASVVLVYIAAAVAGGAAETHWGLAAGAAPVVVVGIVVALAFARFGRRAI